MNITSKRQRGSSDIRGLSPPKLDRINDHMRDVDLIMDHITLTMMSPNFYQG